MRNTEFKMAAFNKNQIGNLDFLCLLYFDVLEACDFDFDFGCVAFRHFVLSTYYGYLVREIDRARNVGFSFLGLPFGYDLV